ncbi:ketopantoate reductase family protein [Chitinophaga sp. Cy-1792]|uniref:ketopantoate reductase family protein n=1 Tax=Chitinophaga sp. Cy-1792 TaxID=2608339 RepID=UPI00141DFB3E|nr:2-dehydropantoate 2-reductase [Chitinophaga sp. Cy-1792]NIG55688.1 2-dehydropantoate 2-reductase [Chitinophaga sp. Cy-1792]
MTLKDKQVFIVGYGAIGKALAVFLQRRGVDVKIARGRIQEEGTSRQQISVQLPDDTIVEAAIDVLPLKALQGQDGVLVLTTKSFGNETLAAALKTMQVNMPVVILQNGLNVEQSFEGSGFENVYRCVLFATSQHLEGQRVRFKPVAVSQVGVIKGSDVLLSEIVALLSTPDFPFGVARDIQPVIWKKAIANSVFNSVCPLLNADNGIFHRDPAAMAIASEIIAECLLVAAAKGVLLEAGDIENTLLQISKSSDGQLISTLQDLNNGRPTEIDTLNIAIAQMATALNMADKVPRTAMLGQLIKIKSALVQPK